MGKNWFRIEVSAGGETHCYFGTSSQVETDFVKAIEANEYVLLEELTYFDEDGKARGWTEWDPHYLPKIYLNPSHVVSVMCLVDDPRKRDRDGNKVLKYPSTIKGKEEE